MNARYKQRNLASCSSACRKVTSFCFFCWFVEKKKRFRRCHESNLWSNLSFNWAAIAEGHVKSLGQDINPNWIWSEIAMIWVDASPGGTEVSSLTISFSQSKVQHSKESRPLNNESRPSISLNNISLLCTFCAGKWKRCFRHLIDDLVWQGKSWEAIYRTLSFEGEGKYEKKISEAKLAFRKFENHPKLLEGLIPFDGSGFFAFKAHGEFFIRSNEFFSPSIIFSTEKNNCHGNLLWQPPLSVIIFELSVFSYSESWIACKLFLISRDVSKETWFLRSH